MNLAKSTMRKCLRYERETLEKNKAAILAFENQDWDPFYDYQNHIILTKRILIEKLKEVLAVGREGVIQSVISPMM